MSADSPVIMREGDVRLLDIASAILLRWRIVATIVLIALLCAVVGWFLLRNSFTAETTLLPNQEEGSMASQLAALGTQLPLNLALLGGAGFDSNQQLVENILDSRTLADSVVSRNGLEERWELRNSVAAREKLKDRTSIQSEEDGSITIAVSDPDPELAALIANAYPVELNRIAIRLSTESAEQKEAFFEHMLAEARGRLEEAEQRLVEFQEGAAAPVVEELALQTMEAAGSLQQLIMLKEIELAQIRRFATPDNPRYQQIQSELSALRAQAGQLKSGTRQETDLFVPLREAPELGINFVRVYREFKEREQIYVLLTAGFTQARIDASRDLPIVSVLDPAIVPLGPSAPPLLVLLVLAGFLGVFLGLTAAVVLDWSGRLRQDPQNESFFAAWRRARSEMAEVLPGRSRPGRGAR